VHLHLQMFKILREEDGTFFTIFRPVQNDIVNSVTTIFIHYVLIRVQHINYYRGIQRCKDVENVF